MRQSQIGMSETAAQAVVSLIQETVARAGLFSLVLSGGSTPGPLYHCLAANYAAHVPWARIHLFWGDERGVPPDHPDSNYRMAFETLIAHVPIPPDHVHRIQGEAATTLAAAAYEEELRRFALRTGQGSRLAFDLILLGMGEDGHTASLFPGAAALAETQRWVVATEAPADAAIRSRVTLTLPLINQARQVFFLVSGAAKRPLLQMMAEQPAEAARRLPVARVRPSIPPTWFLDEAAAPSAAA